MEAFFFFFICIKNDGAKSTERLINIENYRDHQEIKGKAEIVRCFIDFSSEITIFFNFLIELLEAIFVYKVARRTSSKLVKIAVFL